MHDTFEVTFQYYKNVFCGKRIKDEYSLNSVLLLAGQYMEKYTYCNAEPNYSSDITKNCICAICDILYTKQEQEALESESFDTFTKKYKSVDWDKQILQTMTLYLPERLLYRGVDFYA